MSAFNTECGGPEHCENSVKYRILCSARRCGAVSGALAAYYIWVELTGIALRCPFNLATGLLCPSCGITRACLSLARGDITAAYNYNQALFWILPLAISDFVWFHYNYFRYGKKESRFHSIAVTVMCILLIGFGIWRNL